MPYPTVVDEPKATIVTGSPAAMRLATRGSVPDELAIPFAGRQGTRVKISPARTATFFTVSIVLVARLFFGSEAIEAGSSDDTRCTGETSEGSSLQRITVVTAPVSDNASNEATATRPNFISAEPSHHPA